MRIRKRARDVVRMGILAVALSLPAGAPWVQGAPTFAGVRP